MIIFNDASSGFKTSYSLLNFYFSVFNHDPVCECVCGVCGCGWGHTLIIFASFVCVMLRLELRVSHILNKLLLSELHSQAPDRF